jgi:hypothetical protein
MGWGDLPGFELDLAGALETFDWARAGELCRQLAARLRSEPAPPPEDRARSILQRLRRKRRFDCMALVADALSTYSLVSSGILLQYAQALIERGYLVPAEQMLRSIVGSATPSSFEDIEARGLLGRIGKQRYVTAQAPGAGPSQAQLAQAVSDYLQAYRANPAANYWHGINAVALICRAHRDGFELPNAPDPGTIAAAILAAATPVRRPPDQVAPFVLATILESRVAMGDDAEAERAAADYAACQDADAFEIASTLRQLVEVWQLDDDRTSGRRIVALLRAALLRREGGGLRLSDETARANLRDVDAIRADPALEKVLGQDGFKTLEWYRAGLDRCRAIARIETLSGQAMGTGWLLDASAFFGGRHAGQALLLTNAHVISPKGSQRMAPLAPAHARANFCVTETISKVGEVVWTSPVPELDATIVTLASPPQGVAGLAAAADPPTMADPSGRAPRLYVIGYPGGRNLEFSLQDNVMLACNDRLVHYRTPTEGGSSGSPVFEEQEWTVVALHHAGRRDMPRLDGKGTYEANEGIEIHAIQQATRSV